MALCNTSSKGVTICIRIKIDPACLTISISWVDIFQFLSLKLSYFFSWFADTLYSLLQTIKLLYLMLSFLCIFFFKLPHDSVRLQYCSGQNWSRIPWSISRIGVVVVGVVVVGLSIGVVVIGLSIGVVVVG